MIFSCFNSSVKMKWSPKDEWAPSHQSCSWLLIIHPNGHKTDHSRSKFKIKPSPTLLHQTTSTILVFLFHVSLNLTTKIQSLKTPRFPYPMAIGLYSQVPCVMFFLWFLLYCHDEDSGFTLSLVKKTDPAILKQYPCRSLAINWSENSSPPETLTVMPRSSLST